MRHCIISIPLLLKCGLNMQFYFLAGKVGDWKNYFTVAESEMYDEFIKEELKGSDMKFQYT